MRRLRGPLTSTVATSPESATFEATPDANELASGASVGRSGPVTDPAFGLASFSGVGCFTSKTCGQIPFRLAFIRQPACRVHLPHRFRKQTRPSRLERLQRLFRGFVRLVFRIGQNPLQTGNQRIYKFPQCVEQTPILALDDFQQRRFKLAVFGGLNELHKEFVLASEIRIPFATSSVVVSLCTRALVLVTQL